MQRITGSGVIPYELYTNKNNRTDLAIILFFDIHRHKFSDAGGAIFDGKPGVLSKNIIIKTAIKELQEESCNLFIINNPKLLQNYVRIKEYVGFFVGLDQNKSINVKYYYKNLKLILNNKNINKSFKETRGITHVYIKDIIENGMINKSTGDIEVLDAEMNSIKIFKRTAELLINAFKHNIFKNISFNKTVLHKHKNNNNVLKNTTSYIIT